MTKPLATLFEVDRPSYPATRAVGVHAGTRRLAWAGSELTIASLDQDALATVSLPTEDAEWLAWSTDGDELLVACDDQLLRLAPDGTPRAPVDMQPPIKGPAAHQRNLFFGGVVAWGDGWAATANYPTPELVRIDRKGKVLWSTPLAGSYTHSMPTVATAGDRALVSDPMGGTRIFSQSGDLLASLPGGSHLCGAYDEGRAFCRTEANETTPVWWREHEGTWQSTAVAGADDKYRLDTLAVRASDGLVFVSSGSRATVYREGEPVAKRARAAFGQMTALHLDGELAITACRGLVRVLALPPVEPLMNADAPE